MTRHIACVLAVVLAAALVGACGERREPTGPPGVERLRLMLDYFPNADHAGIYAAQARGEFRRAGLDVEIEQPGDAATPLKLLAAGRVDLAISYEPELLLARAQGVPLVAVGALVQRPLTSIISIGRRAIRDPRQLRGTTVGTAGIPYQSAYLKAILRRAGVPESSVKVVNVGFNLVPAMLSRRVDATLGGFWNYEGIQLDQQGKEPRVIRVDSVGVPTYDELVIVARERDLRDRGDLVRRFMRALARGHEALRGDLDAGLDPLLAANHDLTRHLQLASLKATLPAFFPSGDRPFGYMDPTQWRSYGTWMRDNGLVERHIDAGRALSNEFLPGEGLAGIGTRSPTP